MPLWLPLLGILLAFGILFAPDPVESEPAVPDDDNGLPDDYVPPFVPPPPSSSPRPWRLRPVEPKAPAFAQPVPAVVTDAVPATRPPAQQSHADASCWPQSFPAG